MRWTGAFKPKKEDPGELCGKYVVSKDREGGRSRTSDRYSNHRRDCGRPGIPQWTAVCRVAGLGSTSVLESHGGSVAMRVKLSTTLKIRSRRPLAATSLAKSTANYAKQTRCLFPDSAQSEPAADAIAPCSRFRRVRLTLKPRSRYTRRTRLWLMRSSPSRRSCASSIHSPVAESRLLARQLQ